MVNTPIRAAMLWNRLHLKCYPETCAFIDSKQNDTLYMYALEQGKFTLHFHQQNLANTQNSCTLLQEGRRK